MIMSKICGIYKITNNINGMEYYGQSKDCLNRWSSHKVPSQNEALIDKVIKEFGVENFTFKIEKECLPEELDYYEKDFIKKNNSLWPNGYNRLGGGKGGFDVCDDTKKRFRERIYTIETRQKMSESQKGHICLESTRQKMSELRKGEKNPMYKHNYTEETRHKMSESAKNKPPMSDETKRKISESGKGKHIGPKPKYKYLTPSGEIVEGYAHLVSRDHKDWIKIEE